MHSVCRAQAQLGTEIASKRGMRKRYRTKGFTLIELLVVVNIVAVLAGIASVVHSERTGEARCMELYTVLPQIMRSQSVHYLQHNQYYLADHDDLGSHGVDLSEAQAFRYSTFLNEFSSYSVRAEATSWAPGGWVVYHQRGEPRWNCDGTVIKRNWLPD